MHITPMQVVLKDSNCFFLSTSALKQSTSSDISLLLRFNILRNGLFCARSESDQPELLNYFVNISSLNSGTVSARASGRKMWAECTESVSSWR